MFYVKTSGRQVHYAAKSGGMWAESNLELLSDWGYFEAFVDPTGRPGFVFDEDTILSDWNETPAFYLLDGNTFYQNVIGPVAHDHMHDHTVDIAFDSNGGVHALIVNPVTFDGVSDPNSRLGYERRTPLTNLISDETTERMQWTETVLPFAHGPFDIQVGPEGTPRILISATDPMRYGMLVGSTLDTELVQASAQAAPEVAQWSAFAMDAAGNAHIAYTTPSREMRYAKRTPSGWQVERLSGREAGRPWMALDASGRPHISFFLCETTTNCPKYVLRHTGSSWVRSVAPGAGPLRIHNGTLYMLYDASDVLTVTSTPLP
ncbi:MAG: hypothetical protein HY904_20680 [Deltaproteobacteria bacterium]|nr:hypothetical protein [Deltaproteobacteria bacterium]